jgi:curli biogenesis system outer membrane secretion channel CsgG
MKLGEMLCIAALATLLAAVLPINTSAGACGNASSFSAEKKRIGVVPFENKSQIRDAGLGESMADMLVTELIQNRNYELIERIQLESLLKEQGLTLSGFIDQTDAPKVGQVMGLDYMVFGSIIEASSKDRTSAPPLYSKKKNPTYSATVKVAINVKVVEVKTGATKFSDTGTGEKTINWGERQQSVSAADFLSVVQGAVANAGFKIRREIAPLEPAVLLVEPKKNEVTISMGRNDGIKEGQRYRVVREGDPIYGLDGQTIAGVKILDVASITIKRVEATTAIGKIEKKLLNNKEILRGDLLRLESKHAK